MANFIDYFIYARGLYQNKRGTYPGTQTHVPVTTWKDVTAFYNDLMDKIWSTGLSKNDIENMQPEFSNFEKVNPYRVALNRVGILKASSLIVALQNQTYPDNIEFWQRAQKLAMARNSLGAIPSFSTKVKESWNEAIDDVVEGAARRTKQITDVLPDFGPLAELVKWSTIAGLGFAAYWYILRPKKK